MSLFSPLRSGRLQFVLQRVSAIVIAIYAFALVGFLLANPTVDFDGWVGFMQSPTMIGLGVLTVLALVVHGWIGMWIVGTDYLSESGGRSNKGWRLLYQAVVIVGLVVFAVWGLALVVYGGNPL